MNLGTFIKALQQNNILEILAEPNLVTANGKEANFLVGGEFPVPVLQGGANSGAVTIQFREFGIRLLFTPQITANGTIKLALRQEVSTLDFANGVTLQGTLIPALSTRRAETNVELGEGQTFVVAGLMDNRETDAMSKLPIISSIPILGNLFQEQERKQEQNRAGPAGHSGSDRAAGPQRSEARALLPPGFPEEETRAQGPATGQVQRQEEVSEYSNRPWNWIRGSCSW